MAERALEPSPSGLDPHQLAALALADALMTQPGDLGERDVADVRAHFSPDQLVEVTLKVMKFSTQKVMVALGVDFVLEPTRLAEVSWNRDGSFVPAVTVEETPPTG